MKTREMPPAEKVTSEPDSGIDLVEIDELVARIGRQPDDLIPILQAIQERYRWLPAPALERLPEITDITPAAVTGVSTFYSQFRHQPVGKYVISTCHGTACHVKGITLVEDSLRRFLDIPEGDDTDPDRQFTIQRVACLGCCTMAPAAQIEERTHGYVTSESAPRLVDDFLRQPQDSPAGARQAQFLGGAGERETILAQRLLKELPKGCAEIRVGLGSCCLAKGSGELYDALSSAVAQSHAPVHVKRVGCVGMCHRTPMIEATGEGEPCVLYSGVDVERAPDVIKRHSPPRNFLQRMERWVDETLADMVDEDMDKAVENKAAEWHDPEVRSFMDVQVHIATEHFGAIDPLDFDEYLARDGFKALEVCRREKSPEEIIAEVEKSGLRGRGGAGFPTGKKWSFVRSVEADTKYVICNGDEGDPGAFMDRLLLESFPYRIIEGMMIAARAVDSREGIFYIRHEYPLAVARIQEAIDKCRERGILGPGALGEGHGFDITIKEGAGAFVCGEETALIASIEGDRGMPRIRPPFPAVSGLWEKPTLVNNVESLAMVPWIVRSGAEAFSAIGTEQSKGTKVFALAGKIQRGGLIEVPMGTTVRQIVESVGGGVAPGRTFKAVQIGGPSGGCVPAALADTPIDYEALRDIGAIMGSGGLVVLDDTDCMVDIARYFLQFTQEQSCGKCTHCRVGTRRMLEILTRICEGKGRASDPDKLEQLASTVASGSLCGLGKTAPNPVLTTLQYFRDEYEAHLEGRCPAGRCKSLIQYVTTDDCFGCSRCAQHCPTDAIPMNPYHRHVIEEPRCVRCGICLATCPVDAVEIVSLGN